MPAASQRLIPQLRIRLDGILQTVAVPPPERLTIRVRPLHSRNVNASDSISTQDSDFPNRVIDANTPGQLHEEPSTLTSNEDEFLGTGDVLNQLEKWMSQDGNKDEEDSEDAPEWHFEEQEVRSSDPDYVFCPAPHRHQLLQMFTKHFCMHPAFPEEKVGFMTAKEIRDEAVWAMYRFCRQRELREVWGYMWTQWYSPKKWQLWARSTSTYVSRLRTTMSVENHWRQLKHDFLHHLLRPRLDQLIYILVKKVTPAYLVRANVLEDSYNMGRAKPLTSNQQYFKKAWKTLSQKPISNTNYFTDVKTWTCRCGQQKYNCHHLCKHLVQAVKPPSSTFWHHVHRRRRNPLYRHPCLVPKDGDQLPALLPESSANDGSITDGDDHIWLGDVTELGGDGSWQTLISTAADSLLRKRQRDGTEYDSSSAAPEVISTSVGPNVDEVIHVGDSDDEDLVSIHYNKDINHTLTIVCTDRAKL